MPNLYVYSFASDRENGNSPQWQNTDTQETELQNGYDKIIRIGEFVSGTLPKVESGRFRRYLQEYAQGAQDAIIDFTSPAAKSYYQVRDSLSNDLISPASEMGFYDKLNYRKNMFPMYVEMNVPTLNIGPLGRLIERTKTSTSCMNGLLTLESDRRNFDLSTDLVSIPGAPSPGQAGYDNLAYMAYSSPRAEGVPEIFANSELSKGNWSQEIRTYDVADWISSISSDIDAQVVTEEGQERLPGQCPGLIDRARIQSISNYIESQGKRNLYRYEDLIESILTVPDEQVTETGFCKSETIVYKLVKINARTNDIIQNFYFPNTSKENIIKFVDTQVKPRWKTNYDYQYELYAYAVVYGSNFRFRFSGEQLAEIPTPGGYSGVYSRFSIETTPSTKVIEYPIFTRLQSTLGFGVCYPPVRISHRPPTPPDIRITPYKGNYRQILLNFETGTGDFTGKNAIPAIKMSDKDFNDDLGFRENAIFQKKFLNYSLEFPKLEFKSEGGSDVTKIEVFRTTELPENPENIDVVYRSFGETPYKILSLEADAPLEEEAKAFDCIDTVNPNIKYYYTCRARTGTGFPSNPSEIYEVELVYNDGIYFPIIRLYTPKYAEPKTKDKKFIQYLEIKPAEIQTHVETQMDEENNILTSRRGLMETDVQGKKFLVRITSRDTGRKFDINVSFTKTEPN